MQNKEHSFSFFADFEDINDDVFDIPFPKDLPVLPLRDMVLFPGVILPVAIGRPISMNVIRQVAPSNEIFATATQIDENVEFPGVKDLYQHGVAARVLRLFNHSDGSCTAIIQGLSSVHLTNIHTDIEGIRAHVVGHTEKELDDTVLSALKANVRDCMQEYMHLDERYTEEDLTGFNATYELRYFINNVCTQAPLPVSDKIALLAESNPLNRGTKLLRLLSRQIQFVRLRSDIQRQTQAEIDKQQRDFFLQQEIHNIQQQLGNNTQTDAARFRKKASWLKYSKEAYDTFLQEVGKLERLNPQNPDYQTLYNYLDIMVQLPWGTATSDNLNLISAERVLNKNHYGMKEVKERILEHLAVRHMNGGWGSKSTIICLYGPPGVGKTSLCKSIASAMKRKYVRASLGGLHDEAEIRGHRRTYIGAMPGRIIKGLIKAGSKNPVFVLDEIDKITEDTHNGDPASALLEVLDPEQNKTFHDNYLEVDFDLSKVMFIATANNVGAIPKPLLDRMELIEVNGYITEEKIEIARRHLEPRVKENCGISKYRELKFTKAALEFLIEHYTRESGVRGLEQELDRFYRKMVLHFERNKTFPATKIKPEDVEQILGKPKFTRDIYQGNGFAGVVTGLAWTSVGGEILFIETSLSRGKGQKLTLTGNLGDVMKESAMLAVEFIKAHADDIGVDLRVFDNYNIHIHVPEGAVPKDGPSAGITMTTSLASALTQRLVRHNLAMTGEITLRGKVLPVGGIKEKILAAKRAGITDIILCQDNRKDIEEIDSMYLKGLTFHYVENILDVLQFALLQQQVDHPIQFKFEEEKDK